MPGIDLTTALGRLLSDPALRRDHANDAEGLARRLGIDEAHLEAFLGLDREGLQTQVQALIANRFHEATMLLPATAERLGEDARALFFAFAVFTWPKGHRRHLEDAVTFGEFVKCRNSAAPCQAEYNRLRFMLTQRRCAIHFVARFPNGRRRRPALQLLYRRHDGSRRQGVLYLAP